jgi:hypothetical protein
MQRKPSHLTTSAAILLAIALTLSGMLFLALPAIVLKVTLPLIMLDPTMNFSAYAVAPIITSLYLVGVVLSVPLARTGNWRLVGGALLVVWLIVAVILGFNLWHFRWNADAIPLPPLVLTGTAISLLTICSLLYPIWLWRSSDRQINPLALFAFFFLGCVIGDIGYSLVVEVHLGLAGQIVWGSIFFAAAGLAFLSVYCCLTRLEMPGKVAQGTAPTWLRRVSWMLLGGLPGCAISGVMTYLTTDISASPLLWLIPLVFSQVAWVMAFARMSTHKVTTAGWVAQVLTALVIVAASVYGLGLLRAEERTPEITRIFVAIAALLGAVFLPHRITLLAQSGLLALVLLPIFAGGPLDIASSMGLFLIAVTHMLLGAMLCWGCFGDAVKHVPAEDRLPEFWLCVQAGSLVCGLAYQVLPPLLVPPSWGLIEYPLVLVACLVVRVWRMPWRLREAP